MTASAHLNVIMSICDMIVTIYENKRPIYYLKLNF